MTVYERLLAATLFALVLVGCSEQAAPSTATPTQTVTLPSPTPPAPTATPELATPTPELPVQITQVGVNDELGSPLDVVVSGDHAYLADSSSGLRVVDVSDPANPQQMGFFDPTGSTAGQGVYYTDSYLYLADGLGLLILDVSDPAAPAEAGFHLPPGFTVKVQVSGQYAYAANREGGLSIADISDPANPQSVSNYFDVGSVHVLDVFVSGSYVYAAMEGMGLSVVDVSDPVNPQEIGAFDTTGTAEAIYVSGSHAYLADGEDGLRIFDISDPAQPQEVSFYDTPGYAQDVYLTDTYALVGDESSLLVIDISDPLNPELAGEYETPGLVWGIYTVGAYTYVANGDHGMVILRLEYERPSTLLPSVATRQPSPVPATATEAPSATPWEPTATPTSPLPTPTAAAFAHHASGEPAVIHSFSLHMQSATTGWAILRPSVDAPANRILRTTDGGQTWYDVTPLEPPGGISQAFFLNGDRAWAIEPGEQQAVVWQTGDGGQTWNPGESLDLSAPWSATLTFVDAQDGWLFFGEGIGMFKVPTTVYRTADGGQTWQSIYADAPGQEGGLFSGYKTNFVFQDENTGWAGVGSPYVLPEIVTTSDGGHTWESHFLPPPGPYTESDIGDCEPATAPFVFPPQTVLMVSECWIGDEVRRYHYLTVDGGRTWNSTQIPGSEGAVEFASAQVGWVVSRGGPDGNTSELYQTGDGGRTWALIRQVDWWADQLDFVNDREGWAVARAGEAMALVHTGDGGETWQLLQPLIVP